MARETMRRLSASSSTWSHQLPCCWSPGSPGSQCLSFFPHEGPGLIDLHLIDLDVPRQLVVELLGVVTRPVGEAEDGVETDAAQAAGGPQAGALDEVLGDLKNRLFGELSAVQRGTGPLGEAVAAGGAAEAADVTGLAGPAVGPEVALAALAIGGAIGVGAGEGGPITLRHGGLLAGVRIPTAYRTRGSGGRPMAAPPEICAPCRFWNGLALATKTGPCRPRSESIGAS